MDLEREKIFLPIDHGERNVASSQAATAFGSTDTASGFASFVAGEGDKASGTSAVAMGSARSYSDSPRAVPSRPKCWRAWNPGSPGRRPLVRPKRIPKEK